MHSRYDLEFLKALQAVQSKLAFFPSLPVHDVSGRRMNMGRMRQLLGQPKDNSNDVKVIEFTITSEDNTPIPLFQFVKSNPKGVPASAILHCHGGGMILGSVKDSEQSLMALVAQTGIQIFSVEYRLAPEARGMSATEDCFAALVWLQNHAYDFNVDPSHIAVMGESAGGGLAAAIAVMARDRRNCPPLAKQLLFSPMLDDRNCLPCETLKATASWTYEDNETGWTARLRDRVGTDNVSSYEAPARVQDVDGLAPAYIDVGELDIFRDESVMYACRLMKSGISTELHVYTGVPHGFENFGENVPVVAAAMANRKRAMFTI